MKGKALVMAALTWGALAGANQEVWAQSEDEQAALAVVNGLFDGMRAKDAAAISSLFTEDAALVTTFTTPEGEPRVRRTPIADFVAGLAQVEAHVDERIWDAEIQLSDNLATVWVKYALYVDEEFSHCGVDSVHLFRSADGWKIFHLADTRRRADCWMGPS